MAGSVRPPSPIRVRREELIRPTDRNRDFTNRIAQRHLQQKERPRWHLIVYGVFAAALLAIGSVTYTTYAFSKYRGEILPGVYVDQTPLGGLTETQASTRISNQLFRIGQVPVRLTHGAQFWNPKSTDIGLYYDIKRTVREAGQVGRHESFFEQLLDRLPLHPRHSVPLTYSITTRDLQRYIERNIARVLRRDMSNANLKVQSDHVVVVPSVPGIRVDVKGTETEVESALGTLSKQAKDVPVKHISPIIPDAYALRVKSRVEAFLNRTPVIGIGKRVYPSDRTQFASMLSFRQKIGRSQASIVMNVDQTAVTAFVAAMAAKVDRAPQNPRLRFDAGKVVTVAQLTTGRTVDQVVAQQRLLKVVTALTPQARIRFPVRITQPPIDTTNPASLGIRIPLGTGETGFAGSGKARLDEITAIAGRLNNVLIQPGQDISFSTLVTGAWPAQDYVDQEIEKNGLLVPGRSGAMQQVATTFLRALWSSGLKVLERHAHVYRLQWYEPPIGLDAIVSPNQYDLRLRNNTGKYLLIETAVQPLRKELWIYVYGPKLGWKITLDSGQVTKTIPHGPDIVEHDPNLTPDQIRQTAWAHNGATTVITRTITYPGGAVTVNRITSHYQAWRAHVITGGPIDKPAIKPHSTPTVASNTTPTPGVSPTPTFNH